MHDKKLQGFILPDVRRVSILCAVISSGKPNSAKNNVDLNTIEINEFEPNDECKIIRLLPKKKKELVPYLLNKRSPFSQLKFEAWFYIKKPDVIWLLDLMYSALLLSA